MTAEYRFFSKAGDPGFACKCGCGLGFDDMDPAFMRKLDRARLRAGVPFVINSGIRCPEHNSNVSSTGKDGAHVSGKACDIRATDSRTRYKIIAALIEAGFTRIGVSHKQGFVHADSDPSKPAQVFWLYD